MQVPYWSLCDFGVDLDPGAKFLQVRFHQGIVGTCFLLAASVGALPFGGMELVVALSRATSLCPTFTIKS